MSQSLQLVFNYFFAVGAGIGLGLLVAIGLPVVIYTKITGVKSWGSKKNK